MIYNAVYLAIFLQFLRNVLNKVKIAFDHELKVERRDHSDEFYVFVSGTPVYWSSDEDDAIAFTYAAIARCPSLYKKVQVVECGDDLVLFGVENISYLNSEEALAVNETIDEFE